MLKSAFIWCSERVPSTWFFGTLPPTFSLIPVCLFPSKLKGWADKITLWRDLYHMYMLFYMLAFHCDSKNGHIVVLYIEPQDSSS